MTAVTEGRCPCAICAGLSPTFNRQWSIETLDLGSRCQCIAYSLYDILVRGASGAADASGTRSGGFGTSEYARFNLTAGTQLDIVVGSNDGSHGGYGGTYGGGGGAGFKVTRHKPDTTVHNKSVVPRCGAFELVNIGSAPTACALVSAGC